MKDRTLALAGLFQALRSVKLMATTGQFETAPLATCIESLFRFDADSTEAVFGDASRLQQGLNTLIAQLEGGAGRDTAITRMAVTVLQLERRFMANTSAGAAMQQGLHELAALHAQWGPTHPTVLARLGELYARVLSPIGPRVLVQGNPTWLGQPQLVGEVRAGLLAAVRCAVLWRQLGGSYWDFLLSRRSHVSAARDWLNPARA